MVSDPEQQYWVISKTQPQQIAAIKNLGNYLKLNTESTCGTEVVVIAVILPYNYLIDSKLNIINAHVNKFIIVIHKRQSRK